jgi:chemotaxis response regulator CheB
LEDLWLEKIQQPSQVERLLQAFATRAGFLPDGVLGRDVIVIGGSAGAVAALHELLQRLPRNLAASIFVTVHIGGHGISFLPERLAKGCDLPVRWAQPITLWRRGLGARSQ